MKQTGKSNDPNLSLIADRLPFQGKAVRVMTDLQKVRVFSKENAVLDGIQTYLDYSIGGLGFIFKNCRYEAMFNRFNAFAMKRIDDITNLAPAKVLKFYKTFKDQELAYVQKWITEFAVEHRLLPPSFASLMWEGFSDHNKPPKEFFMAVKFSQCLFEFYAKTEYPLDKDVEPEFISWISSIADALQSVEDPIPEPEKVPEKAMPPAATLKSEVENQVLEEIVSMTETGTINEIAKAIDDVYEGVEDEVILVIRRDRRKEFHENRTVVEVVTMKLPPEQGKFLEKEEFYRHGSQGDKLYPTRVQDSDVPRKQKAPDKDPDEFEEFFGDWKRNASVKPPDISKTSNINLSSREELYRRTDHPPTRRVVMTTKKGKPDRGEEGSYDPPSSGLG